MPRLALGPRLYLDPKRKQWVIRDGVKFIRTSAAADDVESAKSALATYLINCPYVPAKKSAEYGLGLIYFLTAAHPDYPIKIGFTERLESLRIRKLQTACPYTLYFLGHIPGSMAEERGIHRRFDHLRLSGEWFKHTVELRSFIQSVCQEEAAVAVPMGGIND